MTGSSHPLASGAPPDWATSWGEDVYGVFAGLAVGSGDLEYIFRWIPPGVFWMGSPESEVGRHANEVPHRVTLTDGFWLGETPVTQMVWQAVMDGNPSMFETPDRPVERVSWTDVDEFIAALNRASSRARCDYLRKQSGSMRAERALRLPPIPGNLSWSQTHMRRSSTRLPGTPATAVMSSMCRGLNTSGVMRTDRRSSNTRRLRQPRGVLASKKRTDGACRTCWGTYGSGARIGTANMPTVQL